MKKSLLSTILLASLAMASCKKDPVATNESDPFKLSYSNLSVEQQKQQLEQSGRTFLQQVNDLPSLPSVAVMSHLAGLAGSFDFGKIQTLSAMLDAGKAARQKNVMGVMKTMSTTTPASDASALADFLGVYTWSASKNDWTKSANTDCLTLRFPSAPGSASNDAELVIKSVTAGVSNGVQLPAEISGVLKVGGKTEMKMAALFHYNEGAPVDIDLILDFGGYKCENSLKNNSTSVSSNSVFSKGDQPLVSMSTDANGDLSPAQIASADPSEILTSANTTIQVLDVKLAGLVNYQGIHDSNESLAQTPEPEKCAKQADAYNQNSKFVAVNTTDNTVIAKNSFESVSSQDCYIVNGVTQCQPTYSVEPQLVFGDGSKVSFETFFGVSFADMLDALSEYSIASK